MIIKALGLSLITLSLTFLGSKMSEEAKEKHRAKEELLCLMKEIER